ncbi:RNA-binding domain-containing protein [Wallemia mellicola]|uniref:RNA-binding domain-containing protein n=2 Tax=Wallemia mellicola TaxID=1708541 RepID=A0A4T0NRN4_9BASI|nr:RNA-binding domain-containing protein [Wallemia mellicola CBS 633.66]TIB69970.1 hypothetical protein E3Q24_03192 [Wallemia mellicola]EIM22578.1 RNA-binding domain-containing protein [Wallemia mellicola CBS 633.66]TIB75671.1 hypothetical protein E3Q23_02242 [Wallemia mellicola]TIB78429.1 RNA-binding domain-containing protein [Wallemia mellicola]TIB84045.1 RNA-binding domain-containing protein [Wallemia mellicola]|eukprot:XP_006957248.1 RNA-binding domain-containing protein [Wallemia mellicola CBS 633.66]
MADSNDYNNPTNEEPTFEEDDEDKEIAAMKERVKQMEEEAARLREVQENVEQKPEEDQQQQPQQLESQEQSTFEGQDAEMMQESSEDVDGRSVYVGNVDYSATPEDLQKHFAACGTINRVTILCDKFTGHPKGYAYIEFAEPSLVENASALNESLFKGRLIKVVAKRKNVPFFALKRARGRGRGRGGFRGRPYRGRGRGSFY